MQKLLFLLVLILNIHLAAQPGITYANAFAEHETSDSFSIVLTKTKASKYHVKSCEVTRHFYNKKLKEGREKKYTIYIYALNGNLLHKQVEKQFAIDLQYDALGNVTEYIMKSKNKVLEKITCIYNYYKNGYSFREKCEGKACFFKEDIGTFKDSANIKLSYTGYNGMDSNKWVSIKNDSGKTYYLYDYYSPKNINSFLSVSAYYTKWNSDSTTKFFIYKCLSGISSNATERQSELHFDKAHNLQYIEIKTYPYLIREFSIKYDINKLVEVTNHFGFGYKLFYKDGSNLPEYIIYYQNGAPLYKDVCKYEYY